MRSTVRLGFVEAWCVLIFASPWVQAEGEPKEPLRPDDQAVVDQAELTGEQVRNDCGHRAYAGRAFPPRDPGRDAIHKRGVESPPRGRRRTTRGRLSITDVLQVLYTAVGLLEPPVDCRDVFDVDDDGRVTATDGMTLFRYLFLQGPDLPAPFLGCGRDATVDDLSCAQSSCP